MRSIISALAAFAILMTAPATAHMGATGVVKERMDLMSALGRTMKALRALAYGDRPVDAGAVGGNDPQPQRAHA